MEYKTKKPNFCQNCGNSLTLGSQPVKEEEYEETNDLEPQEENSDILIKKLEFDFEPNSPASETLGTIFQRASQEQQAPTTEDFTPSNPMSADEHLQAFRDEAGTLKSKEEE
jgi:hypothetical protein